MVTVRFLPENKVIEVKEGGTILEAARLASVVIESPCDGTGRCGKCKVKLTKPLSDQQEDASFHLACQTEVSTDLVVKISDSNNPGVPRVLEEGESLSFSLNPYMRKEFVEEDERTLVYANEKVITIEKGNTQNEIFGLVVDIGTTTIAASLIDLKKGVEISSTSSLNPQSIHAQDVLSRIKLSSTKEGLRFMHAILTAELNRMIGEMTNGNGISRDKIYEVVYSGNTCMLHLATAIDPSALGRYPYASALEGNQYRSARLLGLSIADHAQVYLPPIISGFIGADITSGILATALHTRKGATLFIDIGTNGEMVLSYNEHLIGASAAAGPAFEGMSITCGMRAGEGAIETFLIEPPGSITVKTIGDTEPRGICGSGLLDVVAELVSHKLITQEGRLTIPEKQNGHSLAARFGEKDNSRVFFLTDAVYVSQKDIRQVQLAKGAIRTGIEFLLKHAGISPHQVDTVLIAGAFGYHARIKSLIDIGFLPEDFQGKIRLVGNTSKSGGVAYLLNRESRELLHSVAVRTEVIELAHCAGFDRAFMQSLAFKERGAQIKCP